MSGLLVFDRLPQPANLYTDPGGFEEPSDFSISFQCSPPCDPKPHCLKIHDSKPGMAQLCHFRSIQAYIDGHGYCMRCKEVHKVPEASKDYRDDLALGGIPCPPHSNKRAKRTQPGNVEAHHLHGMASKAIEVQIGRYCRWGLYEDVKGIFQPNSRLDESCDGDRFVNEFRTRGGEAVAFEFDSERWVEMLRGRPELRLRKFLRAEDPMQVILYASCRAPFH